MTDHLSRLLLAAQCGDAAALDRFILETQSDVWQLCRYLGDAADADDLAQETYERAIKSIRRYRGDGPARGWLLTIARRVCADHVRRAQRRRRKLQAVTDEFAAGADWENDPTGHVDLDALVEALDPDRREAFVLTQMLGLHYDEAAEIMGCQIGTIRSRVSRARQQLSTMLDEQADRGADDRASGTN